MKNNNGKVLLGILLSVAGFLDLILPTWTVEIVSSSRYDVYTNSYTFSPFSLIGSVDLLGEEFAFLSGFSLILVLGMLACVIVNFILTLVNKNSNKPASGGMLVPGIFMVIISGIYMLIGFVACATYGIYAVPVALGELGFFMVLGLFIPFCILSKAVNKPVGPAIVNGQHVSTNSGVPSYAAKPQPSAQPYQYAQQSQHANVQPKPTVKTAGPDGRVYGNLQGAQRILDVYEDRVKLTQIQNFRAFLTQDLYKGEKEIPFAMMTSIQYKPASTMILGYLQFEVPGVASGNNFGSENSWTFDESMNTIAQQVCDYCKKRVIDVHTPHSTQVVQQTSAADEILKLKQLLDSGIITQEEFDAKKKQLLDL